MASHANQGGEGFSASGFLIRLALAFVLVSVLAAGLSWSHSSRRLTGQVAADIVD
jgi:hypothetical protein